jgi:E3 ubiquitin-protein ligase EDD1
MSLYCKCNLERYLKYEYQKTCMLVQLGIIEYNAIYLVLQNVNIHHPKTVALGLLSERIVQISATVIRCSVATESGKVATWMDELLNHAALKLEHPAQSFTEFTVDRIVSLHTCALYTVSRLESGALYWW